MNPESKKLKFLGSCGILLEEKAQHTPEKNGAVVSSPYLSSERIS